MKDLDRIKELAGIPLNEGKSDYQVYHSSYTNAVQEAKALAERRGYEIDEDNWFSEIGVGPGKPSVGKYTKHSVDLYRDGKLQKKALQIQVYGLESGNYELNAYIL